MAILVSLASILGAFVIVQLTLVDTLVAGKPLLDAENVFRVPGVGLALFAAFSENARVHAGLAIGALVLLAGFLANSIEL